MAEATRTLQSLPAELQFSIVSYLQARDAKQFSLCSKSCRRVSLPVIYQNLDVSVASQQNPSALVEKITAAFQNEDGILHGIQSHVRFVTLSSEHVDNMDSIISYFRGCATLLSLFPFLNGIKITYLSPTARFRPFPDFDNRLFYSFLSTLSETCPTYQTIKKLHLKTGIYEYSVPDRAFSAPNEQFLRPAPANASLIPYPPALREAYLDREFRLTTLPGTIDVLDYISLSRSTLRSFGIWMDLNTLTALSFPGYQHWENVTTLGINLDFLARLNYLHELGRRFPNVERVNVYLDRVAQGGYWEEEAIKVYKSFFAIWNATLKTVRLPWFTNDEILLEIDPMARMIRSWIVQYQPTKLEKVILIRDFTVEEFEAVTYSVSGAGDGTKLEPSEIYTVGKLELDGL